MLPLRCAPLLLLGLAALAGGQQQQRFAWGPEDELNTEDDPWTSCQRTGADGVVVRGFCRLKCTARWSYAPHRMDCEMLPYEELLARAHSKGQSIFRKLSQDSFSKVNSGTSPLGPNDPDVA